MDLLGGGGMTLGNHDHDHVWSCHSSPLLEGQYRGYMIIQK